MIPTWKTLQELEKFLSHLTLKMRVLLSCMINRCLKKGNWTQAAATALRRGEKRFEKAERHNCIKMPRYFPEYSKGGGKKKKKKKPVLAAPLPKMTMHWCVLKRAEPGRPAVQGAGTEECFPCSPLTSNSKY